MNDFFNAEHVSICFARYCIGFSWSQLIFIILLLCSKASFHFLVSCSENISLRTIRPS